MNVLLPGRAPRLERWRARPCWPDAERGWHEGARRDAYERVVAHEPPGDPIAGGAHRRLAAAVLRYDVFPPQLLERVLAREPVDVGDVVGAAYRLAPGIRVFFASRVVDRFDERAGALWRTGFTYRTLHGHPEIGEETFSVEKDLATGAVTVALRSWSRPGTLLARAAAPLVRRLQVSASRAALDHLQAVVAP